MTLAETLQISAGALGAIATAFAAAENLVLKSFRSSGAVTPDAAMELPSFRPITRWRLARLRTQGAIVVRSDGRAFLDEAAYLPLRKRRRIVGISLVFFTLAVVSGLHLAFH